jgi:hypothetical protein
MKKRYQSGGLAEAVGVDDEDSYGDANSDGTVGGSGALDAAASQRTVGDALPDSLQASVQAARKVNQSAYERAIARLRSGQEALLAMKPEDKSTRWLALAQGMLAPTKTGGFGESVSNSAGLVRQQQELTNKEALERQLALQRINEQEAGAENEYAKNEIDILGKEAGYQVGQARARVLGSYNAIVKAGIEAANLGLDPSTDHVVRYSEVLMPGGETVRHLSEADGKPIEVAATVNPLTVTSTTTAREEAEGASTDYTKHINAATGAMVVQPKIKEAYRILAKVKAGGGTTSGLKADMLRLTEYLGITEAIPEGTQLLALQSKVGGALMDQLLQLTGSKTDFEYRKIEQQHARLTQNVDTNMRVLDDMLQTYDDTIDRGYTAAGQIKNKGYREYIRGQIDAYRKKQGDTPAEVNRKPSTASLERFLQRMRDAKAPDQQKKEIEMFQKRFDMSDDIVVELRKLGVAI